MMEPIQITTVSTVDAVKNALEADILSLYFPPGLKLTESDLALRYNVSRNTVREAIAHLLAQGLLTKIANKGVYVRRFTTEDVQEIFQLRALLELEAVSQIFAGNHTTTHLYSLVEILEQLNRQTGWDDYVKADIQFHNTLVAAAGSSRLSRLYETILTEVKLCIYQTRNYVQIPNSTQSSHREILDAINGNDKDAARKLLKEHIEHVIKRYCGGLLAMDNGNL